MLLNDIGYDITVKSREQKISKKELASIMGISNCGISQVAKVNVVTQKFIKIMEILGYDIRIEYVKRNVDTQEGVG